MNVRILKMRTSPTPMRLPLYSSRVPAGFPSAADDYLESDLDLNEYLIKHPASTFLARADGLSMVNAGILDGALLVVDRSLKPQHDDIVIASVDGQLTCKILDTRIRALRSANLDFSPMHIADGSDLQIFGVVIHAVNRLCSRS